MTIKSRQDVVNTIIGNVTEVASTSLDDTGTTDNVLLNSGNTLKRQVIQVFVKQESGAITSQTQDIYVEYDPQGEEIQAYLGGRVAKDWVDPEIEIDSVTLVFTDLETKKAQNTIADWEPTDGKVVVGERDVPVVALIDANNNVELNAVAVINGAPVYKKFRKV